MEDYNNAMQMLLNFTYVTSVPWIILPNRCTEMYRNSTATYMCLVCFCSKTIFGAQYSHGRTYT